MLDEGTVTNPGVKVSRPLAKLPLQDSYFIQSPSTEPSSCQNSPRGLKGPIISDVSEASLSPERIMSPSSSTGREKGPVLLKEEPASPGGKGTAGPGVAPNDYDFYVTAPPVLPVAVVQSILEGKGSCSPEGHKSIQQPERRGPRGPPDRELGEPLDVADLSLESLQLLLRGQPGSLEPEAGLEMQQLPKDMEKSETELVSKGSNPPGSGKEPAASRTPRTFPMEAPSSFGAPALGVPGALALYDPSQTLAHNGTRTSYLSPGASPDP
uniref:Vertebrate heat shock transcription factor C-terminal domain-containing protein n=1 Tax=Vombatus ursinus TaxID=29139 RepID=A0A4X2M2X8_VOMUR